jgi:DNA excision repair protein ERCC-2
MNKLPRMHSSLAQVSLVHILAETMLIIIPVLPDDLLKEAIPGNIRKAEHFVAFLKRFVEYLKTRMRVLHVVAETPLSFLQHLKDITYIERRPLRYGTYILVFPP